MSRLSRAALLLVAPVAFLACGVAAASDLASPPFIEEIDSPTGMRALVDSYGDSSDGSSDSYPTAGIVAIVLLGVGALVSVLFPWLLRTPPQSMPTQRDWTSLCIRLTMMIIAAISFVLKLAAFGADNWDSSSYSSVGVNIRFGVVAMHIDTSVSGLSGSVSYHKECSLLEELGDSTTTGLCQTAYAASLLTISVGVFALLSSFIAVACLLFSTAKRASFLPLAVRVWRALGFTVITSFAIALFWLGFHTVQHDSIFKSDLDTSYYVWVVSVILDILLALVARSLAKARFSLSPLDAQLSVTGRDVPQQSLYQPLAPNNVVVVNNPQNTNVYPQMYAQPPYSSQL